jgi:serine/threonine-protein kinase
MIGQTISHYKISDKLGEGGMGVVYKAEDTKLKRTVALKFLPQQTLGTDEDRARFIREAQAAAALDHASICTTYEINEAAGQTFIAMAYVDGKTLEEKIKSGPMDPKDAVNIIVQVAEGLREAHDKGIVHRDIKSANIMIGNRGQAKIMDFGLAKLAGATKLTKTATVMGTVAYMSPEQALGQPLDHRTDIWSLGVVLHEMLTGKLPFMAENDAALLHKIIYDEPDSATGINPYVPPGLSIVVAKALAKDREERYQSTTEFIQDIRSFETLQSAPLPFSLKKISDENPKAYKRAEKKVRAKMKFYKHLQFYIFTNGLLLLINLVFSPEALWFFYPLMVFTVPLSFHAFKVYVLPDRHLLKERLMETELRKETSKDKRA